MDLRELAPNSGCFYARHPLFPASRCAEALAGARTFFDLPPEQKRQLAIERSTNFRGYSEMHNERDWREQIHFGREESDAAGLRGPNLWPPDTAWKSRVLTLITDLEQAARDILAAITSTHGLPNPLDPNEDPYLLLKMILYLPSESPRSGVAPHVDFSWITLLLQDDTGGLEIRTSRGEWLPAPAIPGWLMVNAGEVLEFASRGRILATPHRVVNPSRSRSRISLPFFLNPSLDKCVEPLSTCPETPRPPDSEHIHRVFATPRRTAFQFGEREWKRKGLGIWCETCVSG